MFELVSNNPHKRNLSDLDNKSHVLDLVFPVINFKKKTTQIKKPN